MIRVYNFDVTIRAMSPELQVLSLHRSIIFFRLDVRFNGDSFNVKNVCITFTDSNEYTFNVN